MPIEPPPSRWRLTPPRPEDDDVVGAGADLAPGTLLAAYRSGLFPMRAGTEDLLWWSPRRRGVLGVADLRVSRSLRRSVRRYEVRVDTALPQVIAACADPERPMGWIDDDIAAAYVDLHELGWVHSVETWSGGELVGGLYGVAVGGLFAGESMFHTAPDASKVALVALVDLLRDEYADRRLVDAQWQTPHLASLGVRELPRADYLARLPDLLAVPLPAAFGGAT